MSRSSKPYFTQPVEHIAAKPIPQPPLRKSMSRVLSRVISITRKDPSASSSHPRIQDAERAVLRKGSERAVQIDRGYEVIPHVTSTHLKRSESGLREVTLNVPAEGHPTSKLFAPAPRQ